MRTSLVRVVVIIGLWGLSGGLWVGAQHASPPPSQTQSAVRADAAVPVEVLSSINTDSLREADRQRDDRIAPYRRDTHIVPSDAGVWERLPSGDWLWRVRVQSPEAQSVSVNFAPFELPGGARLFVHAGNGQTVRGPYTAADATQGEHHTPLVRSDEVVVELVVPDGQRDALDLVLSGVVHGYRSMPPSGGGLSKSGSCNLDVACAEADPWRRQVRAAGLYSFEWDGSARVCSGSLVNNTADDGRPLFLTAEHCVPTDSVASTMTFYWNYQNATCRQQGTSNNGTVTSDDRLDQTSSGAVLRVRYGSVHETGSIFGKPDLALVEVDDTIPPRYDLFFNGWSRAGQATAEAATVHHPRGDGKRISFDRQPTDITAYANDDPGSGDTHLRVGDWEVGTTEGGSSGSSLYDAEQHVVGVLSGGVAGCGRGGVDDNNKPDWYGRIAPGFTNGDYTPEDFTEPATLADWLDPANTDVQRLDGRPQQDQPTMGSPTDLTATTAPERVRLDWSVPDTVEAAAYRLYRSTTPIDSTIVTRSVYRPLRRLSAGTTAFVDSTALPGTTYHYRVTTADSAAYEGAFSNEATATVTVPGVQLADGRDGDAYEAPDPIPGTDQNPVGRFLLVPDSAGVQLDSVAVDTDGTASGVAAAELWQSDDATFNAEKDTLLATDDSGVPARFGSLSVSVPAESTYVFLTLDLEADAAGDYAPVLRSEPALALSGGALAGVNGTPTRTFSDAYLSTAAAPLPVEMTRFDATVQSDAVQLDWTTARETNNAIFEIQRARPEVLATRDVDDLEASGPDDRWRTVGSVEGAGTTTARQHYRFSDTALPKAADTLAYRLKQVDRGGRVSYSKVRAVQRRVEAVTIGDPVPNPARQQVTVPYALPTRQAATLRLYDVLGRRVQTVVDEQQEGRMEASIDVSGLSSGVYVLRLRTEGAVRTRKLTVVR